MTPAELRARILARLYEVRRQDCASGRGDGWVNRIELVREFGADAEFALSVLEEIGHVAARKYQVRISGHGCIVHETTQDKE